MDFTIDKFSGPLDLLLHLIKQSNIDIYDIKIEDITNQYLDYIKKMKELNLNIASSYLVMSAELTMLLPKPEIIEDEYEEDPREKLIQRLIEYQNYKEILPKLHELEFDRKQYYTKKASDISDYDIKTNLNDDVDLSDLLQAFEKFLQKKEDNKPLNTKITTKEYSITKRSKEIRNIIKEKKQVNFVELFDEKTKSYVVVTFLSILVLSKNNEIKIIQENNFEDITNQYLDYIKKMKELNLNIASSYLVMSAELNEIKNILDVNDNDVKMTIHNLIESYKNNSRGIEIAFLGNRLKLITKKENKKYLQKLVDIKDDEHLTEAALETLAIIAYNQPVTRLMIDDIRGVSSSYLIRKLIYKNLICEVGRSEAAGRPVLYGTTPLFLDYFGLKSIKDLPNIEITKDDSVKELYDSKYNEKKL